MTNEEMERAIEFLLKNQANFDARLEQTNQQLTETNRQLGETNRQLGEFADTQADFMRVMTRTLEAQVQINESQREFNASVSTALTRLAEAQAHTDRRLDALIDIVRGERNGG